MTTVTHTGTLWSRRISPRWLSLSYERQSDGLIRVWIRIATLLFGITLGRA